MAFDAGSLINQGFSTIVNTMAKVSNERKQQQLEKYLGELSIQQKTALEARMQNMQSEIERQKILFQAMAVDKNIALAERTSKDRNFSLIVVGVGLAALATVIFLAKRKR